jgi:hypothetical protein
LIDGLLSPVSPEAKSSQIALTGLRLLAGLLWLENVVWKVPPDFGERTGGGLYFWTGLAVKYPVFDPFTWLVEKVVLPNFTPFGWGVLVAETALAVLLLTGTAVRPAALLGVAQSLAIGLSVAESEAPNEWPWAYAMMIGIHAVLFFTPCARYAAVDALRGGPAGSARRLLGGWAIVLAVIGALAAGVYLWYDRNAHVGVRDWELSFGDYNLRGALVLIAVAAAMLAAAVLGGRVVAVAAAAVAAAAAVSIWIQIGRSEVWLGGSNSTAVVFASAAVVSLAAGRNLGAGKRA